MKAAIFALACLPLAGLIVLVIGFRRFVREFDDRAAKEQARKAARLAHWPIPRWPTYTTADCVRDQRR